MEPEFKLKFGDKKIIEKVKAAQKEIDELEEYDKTHSTRKRRVSGTFEGIVEADTEEEAKDRFTDMDIDNYDIEEIELHW